MTVQLNIIKNIDNGRVLVSETNTRNETVNQPKFFSVPEDRADKFIRFRKREDRRARRLYWYTNIGTALVALYTAVAIKGSKLFKIGFGLLAGVGAYVLGKKADNWAINMDDKYSLPFDAIEIKE